MALVKAYSINRISELRIVAGWTPSSKMVETYVHLSGRDAVSSLARKVYGLEPEDEEPITSSIAPQVCHVCGYVNPSTTRICLNCGARLGMSEEEKVEAVKRELLVDSIMSAVMSDEEAASLMRKAVEIAVRRGLITLRSD